MTVTELSLESCWLSIILHIWSVEGREPKPLEWSDVVDVQDLLLLHWDVTFIFQLFSLCYKNILYNCCTNHSRHKWTKTLRSHINLKWGFFQRRDEIKDTFFREDLLTLRKLSNSETEMRPVEMSLCEWEHTNTTGTRLLRGTLPAVEEWPDEEGWTQELGSYNPALPMSVWNCVNNNDRGADHLCRTPALISPTLQQRVDTANTWRHD